MRLLDRCVLLILTAALSLAHGCAATSSLAPPAAEDRAESLSPPAAEEITGIMARVFDWQVERLEPPAAPGWIQSTFMIGVVAAYEATGDRRYLDASLAWSERNDWRVGPPTGHADNHGAAQVYLDLSRISGDPGMFAPSRDVLDALLATPQRGRDLWSWADALFTAPAALARLTAATGDTAYLDAMDAWWWDAAAVLCDSEEHLCHRDGQAKSEVNERGVRSRWGNKLFWSRGNGWVLAGVARVLPFLPPNHPSRGDYVRLYSEMAATIAAHQGEDGLWGASLLDPRETLPPEASASALFCYAIAWGANEGILPRDAYLPVALRAWDGLVSCVGDDGAFGWVQPPGRRPALSFKDGTAPYGAGAFLLAGSEMLRLE